MEANNNAKMFEALVMVKKLFDERIMFQPAIREAHKAVNAALAEPPRNCDRYPTFAAAIDAWREVDPRDAGAFDEWLFAEAKGETK